MSTPDAYHSALSAVPVVAGEPIERHLFADGSVAFAHDLMRGLTDDFDQCDVLYGEPPWPAGVDIFNERAGADWTFSQIYRTIAAIVTSAGKPVVVTTGVRGLQMLPKPTQTLTITLNGAKAFAVCYGVSFEFPGVPSSADVLAELARRFDCIGDFCCGYGRSARAFKAVGKRFVCSDYNAVCISVLKASIK
jgi:hypothetical protein